MVVREAVFLVLAWLPNEEKKCLEGGILGFVLENFGKEMICG